MPRTPAVLFTVFVVVYFSFRAYWASKAQKRKVKETRIFLLDKINLVLVGLFSMIFPLLAFWTSLLSPFDYEWNPILTWLSIPFLLGCLGTFWISHRDLGEDWSPTLELKEEHSLITSGIFKYVRHPMYLSIWLGAIGQALSVPNYVGGLGGLATFGVMYFTRVEKEEQMMLDQFGTEYRNYMTRSKRLIPFLF